MLDDLEEKGRNGQQLVSGRNILDMAKKGTSNFRKALSFAAKKFDLDKMTVKESGNTIDDVIEFVTRVEMYQIHLKDDAVKKKIICLDHDEDNDDMVVEDEYLSSLKNSSNNDANNASPNSNCSVVNKEQKMNLIPKEELVKKSDIVKKNTTKEAGTKKKWIIPPPKWFFPSWISFIQYGPFVPKDKRFSLLEITDASKNVVKTRAEKRKAEKVQKEVKRVNDSSADRGFNTDQKIQLKLIDLTWQQTNDRSRESILMGLCCQEQALTKQIDRAERIAERFAPNDIDDVNNKWWNKVNSLLMKQENIIIQMATLNQKAIDKNDKVENETENLSANSNSVLTNKWFVSVINKEKEPEVLSDLSKDTMTDISTSASS